MDEIQDALRGLVKAVAQAKSIPRVNPAAEPQAFPKDEIWRWLGEITDRYETRRRLMTFAAWAYSTGTTQTDALKAIVLDRVKRNPENPYAYYAPGGIARDCRESQVAIDAGSRQNDLFKQADRDFLEEK
jgi:hypothetical protein